MKRQLPIFGLTTSIARACVTCALLICAFLMTLAAYGGGRPAPAFDVFKLRTGSKIMPDRQFECTSKNADGTCNVNVCKQGPGGYTFDCESFAAACINAGHWYQGTREGGKCIRVL